MSVSIIVLQLYLSTGELLDQMAHDSTGVLVETGCALNAPGQPNLYVRDQL